MIGWVEDLRLALASSGALEAWRSARFERRARRELFRLWSTCVRDGGHDWRREYRASDKPGWRFYRCRHCRMFEWATDEPPRDHLYRPSERWRTGGEDQNRANSTTDLADGARLKCSGPPPK